MVVVPRTAAELNERLYDEEADDLNCWAGTSSLLSVLARKRVAEGVRNLQTAWALATSSREEGNCGRAEEEASEVAVDHSQPFTGRAGPSREEMKREVADDETAHAFSGLATIHGDEDDHGAVCANKLQIGSDLDRKLTSAIMQL